ncbi:unnamed protein product [Rotaria sp. Silwood1]|nr:unnamed protein product [Rotaria sp. Silwood1]CAF3446034.1 unnamed protein product [Rotaria sp. Silwood1]CAF3462738.1 unnamed protein product [Rotaria sp. Silwood1]CAF3504161.1 unnamed protein product [Rotaria sp. Silwood1]CAF3525796.1 unnamed protein product [Rotaria sp. Silwood1]
MVSSSSIVDYYKELNINRHATSIDIRKAYKRLALIWHPDRNKDKGAEEKFKKIKQAYEVLSDENQRREYDQQQLISSQQKQNKRYETTTNMNYTQPNEDAFHLHAFDNFMPNPIDPFDILNDIQFFQESDFTSKMMNSPSYRNLYTYIFDTMNNNPENNHDIYASSPIYFNNDRLFQPASNTRSKHHHHHHHKRSTPKSSPINSIPVIHSTMAKDWFLNELIDLYEQQNRVHIPSSYSPFHSDPFFDDLTHCTNCHKKVSSDRNLLIQHEQQCRQNINRHTTIPSKSVRV